MHTPLKRYLALLVTYLKPQWRSVLLLLVTLLAAVGLQLLSPQILRFFIDAAVAYGASPALVSTGLLFIGVALARQLLSIATAYLDTNVAWTATNQLRADLVDHCLALDMGFHKARTAGEMIERIDGDVDALANFFSQMVINLLTSFLLLSGILVLFFTVDWRVGVVMTLFSLVAFFVLMHIRRRAIPWWKELRQMSATFFGFLGERLVGTEDIRANGATAYVLRRFYALLRAQFPVYLRAKQATTMMSALGLFMFVCGTSLALSLGIYLWSIGTITIGTVYLLFSYTDQLSSPIQQIQLQLQDLQLAEACIRRIEELLALQPALRDGVGAPLPAGALPVEFREVTFGYNAHEPVIHNVTFALQSGRVLGILGRTGSGKTTLARLLFRLYDPQAGEVRVAGVPVTMPYLRELRGRIGLVTQDVQLFHASLRDNLAFFKRTIPDERLLAAIEDVGLSTWYRSLPDGLDTMLGGTGQGLSAGEAQLLAFARVFLADPGLVILDEASSRLDPATEKLVERAVSKLFAGRTALVIAHRLTTIGRADDILIIEDGRVCEYGGREALANDPCSRFAQLLRTGLEEVRA